jgi:predicted transcriptional regulator
MNKYRRIQYEDRCQIYALSKRGASQESIAEVLGVSQSAVSREMQRNRGERGYRFKQAEAKSQARQAIRGKARKLTALTRCKIEAKLRRVRWSPEQISGWLSEQGIKLSHERIYQMIWDDKRDGGNLWRSRRGIDGADERVGRDGDQHARRERGRRKHFEGGVAKIQLQKDRLRGRGNKDDRIIACDLRDGGGEISFLFDHGFHTWHRMLEGLAGESANRCELANGQKDRRWTRGEQQVDWCSTCSRRWLSRARGEALFLHVLWGPLFETLRSTT